MTCLQSATVVDGGYRGVRSFQVIEPCSFDLDLGIPLFRSAFNFRSNIFALAITIRPNEETTSIPTLRHNIIMNPLTPLPSSAPPNVPHLYLWNLLNQLRGLQKTRGLTTIPLSPRIPEIHFCQVSRHTRKDDLAVSPFGEPGIEFVVFDVFVLGVADLETGAPCEDGRHGFGDGGFFGDAQDFHGWGGLLAGIAGIHGRLSQRWSWLFGRVPLRADPSDSLPRG
jgi:hypothetical protein